MPREAIPTPEFHRANLTYIHIFADLRVHITEYSLGQRKHVCAVLMKSSVLHPLSTRCSGTEHSRPCHSGAFRQLLGDSLSTNCANARRQHKGESTANTFKPPDCLPHSDACARFAHHHRAGRLVKCIHLRPFTLPPTSPSLIRSSRLSFHGPRLRLPQSLLLKLLRVLGAQCDSGLSGLHMVGFSALTSARMPKFVPTCDPQSATIIVCCSHTVTCEGAHGISPHTNLSSWCGSSRWE